MGVKSVAWLLVFAAACGKVTGPDAAPTCSDGVENGTETDLDCGGSCTPCEDGLTCVKPEDCASGSCTSGTCAAPTCDDGVKNGDELDVDCAGSCGPGTYKLGHACDDNTQCESLMCAGTNVCIAPKRVFVTVGMFTGAQIGGLTGADAKCQTEATAAGLDGMYRAWLSDLTGSPSTRFTQSTIAPYVRMDGLVLGIDWDDLTDGSIGGPINRTAANQPATGSSVCSGGAIWVVTNTQTNGTMISDQLSCNNWTVNTGGSAWGRITEASSSWTSACTGGTDFCGVAAPLYCFEQ